MCAISSLTSTFAISSPDEFLSTLVIAPATINLLKSLSPLTTDMKGDTKCHNWGGLGLSVVARSLEIAPLDRALTEFLLVFCSNYVFILHLSGDIARNWSKIADFNIPHLCLAPPLG